MVMIKELNYYYQKYPNSKIEDFFKLLYQKNFGSEHFIINEEKSYQLLIQESKNINTHYYQDLYEYIGQNYVRINLQPYLINHFDLNLLNRFFIDSARPIKCKNAFIRDLNTLYDFLIENGFNQTEINEKFFTFRNLNYPPVHHSKIYRESYCPSYRVVNQKYINDEFKFAQFTNYLRTLPTDKISLIAIEGKYGSGKTILSMKAANELPVTVIHCNDFFDIEKESNIGINSQRISQEIFAHIKIGKSLEYRKYDCYTNEYHNIIIEKVKPIVLIVGVYSANPALITQYHSIIYFTINTELQKRRIEEETFKKIWIPKENEYYQKYNVKYKSNIIV